MNMKINMYMNMNTNMNMNMMLIRILECRCAGIPSSWSVRYRQSLVRQCPPMLVRPIAEYRDSNRSDFYHKIYPPEEDGIL